MSRITQLVWLTYDRLSDGRYLIEHPMAARLRIRLKRDVWDGSRIEGLRKFWSIYRLRY